MKRTRIGRIWLMVTSGSEVAALTWSPTCTLSAPVRPAMGARMVAYSRLSRALATVAESALTVARSASAVDAALSCSDCEIRFCSSSGGALGIAARARVCARSRASTARACASAARNGRGSSSNSAWPALTSWPSRIARRVTTPPTCEPTSAVWIGSTVPVARIANGMSRRSTVATVTGTRGLRGALRAPQPAQTTATSASATEKAGRTRADGRGGLTRADPVRTCMGELLGR